MAQSTSREIKVKYNESIELDVRGNKVELTRLEAETLRDELDEVLSNEVECEYELECECIPPQCPYEAWTQWAQWPWIEPWVPMYTGTSVTISNENENVDITGTVYLNGCG